MGDSYKSLKEEAWEANREIPRRGLAIYTWGNVSAFDADKAVFAIKPSGAAYDELTIDDIVVVDLDGAIVAGRLNPSSDTETHRILYREFLRRAAGAAAVVPAGSAIGAAVPGAFPPIRGITHTHSTYAVAFAQARRAVPVYGTSHADHGAGEIPCTAYMDEAAVKNNYELETGNLIIDTFAAQGKNPLDMPMILVAGHGPFTWGASAGQSVYHAAVLEEICKMAHLTLTLDPGAGPLPEYLIQKHWERKHGPNAYYGQR